jgi:LacI family transcriptional regulator
MNKATASTAATISQVAAKAGVSRSTVSRAFTNPKVLSEETVELVREVARRLRYMPNRVARALSTGRHSNVGLIVPDIANPFFPPLIRAAQRRAEHAGLCLFLGDSDEDAAREDSLVATFAPQVEGLVLVSSRLTDERIRAIAKNRTTVLVNRDVRGVPRVLIDTAAGVAAAVVHLYELGHRRIAYISGPVASWSNRERRSAVQRTVKTLGVEIVAFPARRPTYETGREAAPRILATRATAAVTFDDLVAQGLIAGLGACGVDVPAAFSVIGCDDVLGMTTHPPLTTVSARTAEAGRVAIDLVTEAVRVHAAHDVRYVLDAHLVLRATTAPPSQGCTLARSRTGIRRKKRATGVNRD